MNNELLSIDNNNAELVEFTSTVLSILEILNELCKLNPKKACRESDIPVQIIKENLDVVSNLVYSNLHT